MEKILKQDKMIIKEGCISLNKSEKDLFIKNLNNPPVPNDSLKELFK